jgi:two-component system cell cycle response regulator DivK
MSGLPAAEVRILLVEDNEMNSDMLTRRLRRRGYQVSLATDGEAAVAMARELRPHLILMDISLPLIDGHEAIRRVRREEQTTPVAIIALTAHALTEDRDKCLAAGADDYDTKPVELTRLLEKIDALLAQRRFS